MDIHAVDFHCFAEGQLNALEAGIHVIYLPERKEGESHAPEDGATYTTAESEAPEAAPVAESVPEKVAPPDSLKTAGSRRLRDHVIELDLRVRYNNERLTYSPCHNGRLNIRLLPPIFNLGSGLGLWLVLY